MKAVLLSSLLFAASAFGAVAPAAPAPSPSGHVTNAAIAAATIPTGGNPYSNAFLVPDYNFIQQLAGSVIQLEKQHDPFAVTLAKAALFSTFVWLSDSSTVDQQASTALKIARVANPRDGRAPTVQFVVYDLPDRDCSAGASSGEWTSANNGLSNYKTKFIDHIANWIDAFPDVRVIIALEPDALPNLVTNAGVPLCAGAKSTYIAGIQYAISRFSEFPNVALYLDSGNSGWIGWGGNQAGAAQLISQVLAGVPNNATSAVKGVSINVSNYGPNLIPNITDFSDPALKNLQWNPGWDNIHFAQTYGQQLSNVGAPNHFLVDTSRNGVFPIPNHTDNWCNIIGAGLGARPGLANVTSAPNIDGFGWIKTPGQSDGISNTTSPRYVSNCAAPDAMVPAPEAGLWFHDYMVMLAKNAVPAL